MFLVGTEEGVIHKCSSAHWTGYLLSYLGHEMSVYAVKWCPIQPLAFISASADWTVKLWHANEAKVRLMALICKSYIHTSILTSGLLSD